MGAKPTKQKINFKKHLPVSPTQMLQKQQLLFVGPGESGKSTVIKQLIILHKGGFSPNERKEYIDNIGRNLLYGAKQIHSAIENLGIAQEDKEAEAAGERLSQLYSTGVYRLTQSVVDDLICLRSCQATEDALQRVGEFHLEDSWIPYMEKIKGFPDKWGGSKWIPNNEDILLSRVMTSGVQQTEITAEKTTFNLIDTGGQRSERKKWMSLFSTVSATIYVMSLNGFDQNLYEDRGVNRWTEAVDMWRRTTRESALANSILIVFFNKFDLFKEKYLRGDKQLPRLTEDGEDPPLAGDENDENCALAITYLKGVFKQVVRENNQNHGTEHSISNIAFHPTTALNTENIHVITTGIITSILESTGLIFQ